MQRLGDSAMWLREDNLSSKNEIVLPYDEDLILWERPSWIDSLIRLRWCCPAEEEKAEPSPMVKPAKKKKKDKSSKQKQKSRGVAPYPQPHYAYHQQSHYESQHRDVPPPPPLPLTGYQMDPYGPDDMNNGYPQYPNPQHMPLRSGYLTQQVQDDFFQPHHRHHQDLVYSIPNSVVIAQSTSSGSISTKTNDPHLLPNKFLPVVTPELLDRQEQPHLHKDEHSGFQAENPKPMEAAEAAVATLKKHSEKQRHAAASKNPNLPPLLIREPVSPIHDLSPTKASTTPQGRRGQRPRSISPLATPRTHSPQSFSRPRFQSESSKRSIGTASTRHRRQAHESFQFSAGSLNQIAEKQEDVTKTAPPAYIECKTYHEISGERLSIRSLEEFRRDDEHSIDVSVDDEMNNLLGRKPQSRQRDYVSQSEDDEANALRSRNPNLPAISWINSFTAQGDAAAGHPNMQESRPKKIVRTKEKIPAPALTGDGFRINQHNGITIERPVFLPRSKTLDRPIRKSKTTRIVISGWAAISLSDQLRNRLSMMEGPLQIQRSDLAYFQLIQHADPSKRPILRVKQDSGRDHDIVLGDRYDHNVQSLDVCGRAGQCVCLMDASTRQIRLTILPVSLPKYFFREDKIVDEKYFNSWQVALFTPFTTGQPKTISDQASWGPEVCLTQYAPDEQYDAALNVLFAIDTMLRVEKLPWANWSFPVAISG